MTVEEQPHLKSKIDITLEDLSTPDVQARVNELRAAAVPPLTVPVGSAPVTPRTGATTWLKGNTATLALSGALGGLVGWGIAEVGSQPESTNPWYGDSHTVGTIVFVMLFAVGIGAVISGWEGLTARSWPKAKAALGRALPLVLAGGLVGGFTAQKVYESILRGAIKTALRQDSTAAAVSTIKRAMHLGRGVGFALAGAAIGAALGAATRSSKRAINGAIGGVIGGFIGGFMFDYVGDWVGGNSGLLPRMVALVLTGIVIGAAIGLVEAVRKDDWIEIVTGGMAGKQFILYHDRTLIGSAADCHITLIKDPGVAAHQLVLERERTGLVANALPGASPTLVNGVPQTAGLLGDGDLVQISQTVLRYRQKVPAAPTVRL